MRSPWPRVAEFGAHLAYGEYSLYLNRRRSTSPRWVWVLVLIAVVAASLLYEALK
jgi:hypothetical protein